jgi:hypothetical protein
MVTRVCAWGHKGRGRVLSGRDADVNQGEPDVEAENTGAGYVDWVMPKNTEQRLTRT